MIIHHRIHDRIHVSPVRPTLRLFAMAFVVPVARVGTRACIAILWRLSK